LIFIGGIHGVGKTTLCKRIQNDLKITHLSSSDLIAEIKNEKFASKNIKNVTGNQDLLLEALSKHQMEKIHLLDGHFCLLNSRESVVKIPLNTFKNLNPTAIILIIDITENIIRRLNKRDNKSYSYEFIDSFQTSEIEYSKKVAENLRIPIYIFKQDEGYGKFKKVILTLLKRKQV
jgi:adenylate kinase